MIERHDPGSERRLTLGADKGYDTAGFVAECRRMCVTPHVAAKIKHSAHRRPHDAACGLRHEPEEAQAHRGGVRLGEDHRRHGQGESARAARVRHCFTFAMAAYNLIRMPRLLGWAAA